MVRDEECSTHTHRHVPHGGTTPSLRCQALSMPAASLCSTGIGAVLRTTPCHHDVRATTAYGCLPIRVHMVATTADATLAQRHKGTGDTREKSLHIPLWQEGQVALGRRAVGAAFSVEMRLLRSARPEKPLIMDFSGGGVVENSRNFPKKHHQVATLS